MPARDPAETEAAPADEGRSDRLLSSGPLPTHFRTTAAVTGHHRVYQCAPLATLASATRAERLVTPRVSTTCWFQAGLCTSRDTLVVGDAVCQLEAGSDVRPWAWLLPRAVAVAACK